MQVTRRRFLNLTAGTVAVSAALRNAYAQTYPTHPARILSGFPPGGINDTYARLIGQWLSEHLGQQFIIENRPGAGGNLAAEMVAKAEPDGYTLLLTTSADAWNATLYDNLNFSYVRDFTPVATVSRGAGILVVNPSVPDKSLSEFIADAKAHPGKISMASAGIGSAPYMFWELFKSMSGIDLVHVPYHGGGPAVVDLLAGQVQSYFGTFASSIEHVRAGRLRALAVTSATRAAVLPDVPAVAEVLPGYEASIYVGITAPRGTSNDVIATLSASINQALADPGIKKRIADLGDTTLATSPAEFSKLVFDETDKWRKVIRTANIKAE
ncbi:MAG TPA: tripartite tricarboxylate transporter substrate binding protein [Xanthobacteraceae bacterium]|nr:tripartite tricarboxylate transporter substrate binding protein [Xanthobacteraceae bacterium]